MEFSVLGPLSVRADGHELAIRGAKPRALLCLLLAHANRVVPADRLIEDLWEGSPPETAAGTLQNHISTLRRVVGHDRLQTHGGGYVLEAAPGELDAACFEAELAEARRLLAAGDASAAADGLSRALGRWRGAALGELAGATWALAEAARLEELRLVAIESLLEARLELGANAEVVAEAEAMIAKHPLRERLWAQLITAYYRQGRQADALRGYQRLRATLADELGIDPSPDLADLDRKVLAQDPALGGNATAATPAAAPSSASLPTGVVTFLLTDVVGSTRLWETDAAAMAHALGRHDAVLHSSVRTYGGVVLKARGEGDSTFSVFARATDALGAARAAQAMLSAEPWPATAALRVRMAIHTGEALERDADYYGPAVNRVARLRELADGGQVLLTRATADLVIDHLPADCSLTEVGTQELRGLARPETVYRLVGPVPGEPDRSESSGARLPVPARLARLPFTGFHGRASESDLIDRRLKEAMGGTRRVVLIGGEPGIGKTALAAETARMAFTAGATVLYGRCDEDVMLPYGPWVEALDQLFAHEPRALADRLGARRAADLARLVPALGEAIADRPSPTSDPEAQRYLLFGAVLAALGAAAADRPLLVVLDDLHWADKPTLSLLRHVVAASEPLRLLIVGTYRDSELSAANPLSDALAVLRREPGVDRVALGGLADDELVAVVEAAAGQPLRGPELELVQAVYRETDGNPFFAMEIMRHLSETGAVIRSDEGRWQASEDLGEAVLPDSVREVIGRRVARLGDTVGRALSTAAIIGREFDLDVLAAAVGAETQVVLDTVERAEEAGLVSSVGPGRFSFTHALIPHTLAQDMTPTRRAQAHARVAEAIEAGGSTDDRAAELARHWSAATSPTHAERAVDYARQAAEQALAALAPDEALRWFGQAMALVAQQASPDEHVRCDLLIGLGDAQRQVGDPAFRQTLLDAAALAQRLGDSSRLVRAALTNSRGIIVAGRVDPERIRMLEAALAAADPADSAERALLLTGLAEELTFVDDLVRRRALVNAALDTARRVGDVATLVNVMIGWCYAIAIPETLDARRALSEEAMTLADSLGDPLASLRVVRYRYYVTLATADREETDRCMVRAAALAEEIGQPTLRWDILVQQSALALLDGDIDRSERLVTEALELGQSTGEPDAFTLYGAQLFGIRWHQGRESELAELVTKVMADAPDLPVVRAGLALLLVSAGRDDEVTLDVAELDALPRDGAWLLGLELWAEVAVRLGASDVAATVFERLAPFPEQVAGAPQLLGGAVAHYLGMLATSLDRSGEADKYFAQAEAIHERLRAPFHLARTRLEWGRMLLARRDRGDVERGVELVEKAAADARRFGCAGVERSALELLASPAARADPQGNLPAQLTSFVGRTAELAELLRLAQASRMATLTGPGGIGKTRLAIRAAAKLSGEHPDGVWLVELAPLIDSALVASAVASAVGAPPSPGVETTEVVCRFLAHKRALLVLDNCEHVIDAAAELVDRVLSVAPQVRVLATSREPLGLGGELVWRVPSLTVEGSGGQLGDAVALFAERASQVRPSFTIDSANRDAVVRVCRRLDGIPLAIELAAARVSVMSVEQIASRLDERFRLLTRGGRTAVARQQTLQGAIDWSYELLAPAERQAFDVLGVFAGDFDLAAAAVVAAVDEFEMLDLVEQLVGKSMLEADPSRDRYRLLETLRQYAWDRLVANGRLGEVRDAHAAHFATLAGEQAKLMAIAGRQVGALDRLEIDYDNLRAALAHLIETGQAADAVRMIRRLSGFFNIRHPREGLGWFRQVIEVADDLPAKTRARLLGDAAFAAMSSGDPPTHVRYAQSAIETGGSDAPAVAHWLLSQWHGLNGNFPLSVQHGEQAIAGAVASGDLTTHLIATGTLVGALAALGSEPEVRLHIAELIEMSERLGNPTITASAHLCAASAFALLGCHDEALAMYKSGLADADAGGPITACDLRAEHALIVDDTDAVVLLRVAIPIAKDQLAGYHQLGCLVPAAKLMVRTGRPQLAAQFLGACRIQAEEDAVFFVGTYLKMTWYDRLLDQLSSILGQSALDEELRRGAQLTPEQALQFALDELDRRSEPEAKPNL